MSKRDERRDSVDIVEMVALGGHSGSLLSPPTHLLPVRSPVTAVSLSS